MNNPYDAFSEDYDRFVNWPGRLAFELPFIEQKLHEVGARRVLDAATGTGQHVIALAQRGYQADGADLSEGMIEVARRNAAQAGVQADFYVAGFGELEGVLGPPYDAVLCLGNSLPHLLSREALAAALADFAAVLHPGGLLLVQNRNFDAVLAEQGRWMEPQSAQEGEREWLFVRFYDFRADGLIDFNILTLARQSGGAWAQRRSLTQLYPLRQSELEATLIAAGFTQVTSYGGLNGAPFEARQSPNLVVTAIRL